MKILGRRVRYLSAALAPLTLKAPRFSTAILAIRDVSDTGDRSR